MSESTNERRMCVQISRKADGNIRMFHNVSRPLKRRPKGRCVLNMLAVQRTSVQNSSWPARRVAVDRERFGCSEPFHNRCLI